MAKKILVTSTDLMMVQFLVPHVINLVDHGYEIEIACSEVGGRMPEIREKLKEHVKNIHVVRLVRSPVSSGNFNGFKDLKKIINGGNYDLIWTNEPVMGVATRLAAQKARKNGTKVLYMVHGFHFYKGAPLLNWLLFYPIERVLSHYTDDICTINSEDLKHAQKFGTCRSHYIHGIGVDTSRLIVSNNITDIRTELNLKKEDFLILSVGELNKNKNQKVIINALAKLNDTSIHYLLCGKGDQYKSLCEEVDKYGLSDNIHFLGYRNDVVNICRQADLFAFPSIREGLGLAPLEAMYAGLPLVTSNSRGPVDFMESGKTGYLTDAQNINGFAKAIRKLKENDQIRKKMGNYNQKRVVPFCLESVKKEVLILIGSLTDN